MKTMKWEMLLAAFHHFFDEMTEIDERSIFGFLVDPILRYWDIGCLRMKKSLFLTNRGFGLIYIGLSNGLRSWSNQIGTVGCAITIQELRPLELDRGRFVLLAYLDGRGKTKLMKLTDSRAVYETVHLSFRKIVTVLILLLDTWFEIQKILVKNLT